MVRPGARAARPDRWAQRRLRRGHDGDLSADSRADRARPSNRARTARLATPMGEDVGGISQPQGRIGQSARDREGRLMSERATVVGGGLAGIAAALELADAGAAVTVLEVRPRLGGAAYSFQRDGLWLDNGQHVFLRCCAEYRELLHRLGTAADTVLQDRLSIPVLMPGGRTALLRRTGLPAPLHLAGALARYGPLRKRERLAAVIAARELSKVEPESAAADRQNFGGWLRRRRQSPAAIEGLWELISRPTLNLRADETSLAAA